ncbi:MAG: hypothetical protein RL557_142 [archaeon]
MTLSLEQMYEMRGLFVDGNIPVEQIVCRTGYDAEIVRQYAEHQPYEWDEGLASLLRGAVKKVNRVNALLQHTDEEEVSVSTLFNDHFDSIREEHPDMSLYEVAETIKRELGGEK